MDQYPKAPHIGGLMLYFTSYDTIYRAESNILCIFWNWYTYKYINRVTQLTEMGKGSITVKGYQSWWSWVIDRVVGSTGGNWVYLNSWSKIEVSKGARNSQIFKKINTRPTNGGWKDVILSDMSYRPFNKYFN